MILDMRRTEGADPQRADRHAVSGLPWPNPMGSLRLQMFRLKRLRCPVLREVRGVRALEFETSSASKHDRIGLS